MIVQRRVFLLLLIFTPLAAQNSIIDIQPPKGFYRTNVKPGSFPDWIRNLRLLEAGTSVADYKGNIRKSSDDTTLAWVINWPVRGKKLLQCMDVALDLRATYLHERQMEDSIKFPLPGGTWISWPDWRKGLRPVWTGDEFSLRKTEKGQLTDTTLNAFLDFIYLKSFTQTFYHALSPIEPDSVRIGDVVIKRGNRGHAVMIVDLARDADGNLIALVAQGDTPARDFHILSYRTGNPWVPMDPKFQVIPLPIRKSMSWDGLRRLP